MLSCLTGDKGIDLCTSRLCYLQSFMINCFQLDMEVTEIGIPVRTCI